MRIVTLSPPLIITGKEKGRFSKDSRSPAVSKGGCVYYPFWLAYATGLLEQEGHNVRLIDAPARDMTEEQSIKSTIDYNPELIIIQTVTASFYNDIKIAEKIKGLVPEAFIVLSGDHVTAIPTESLKESDAISAVIVGELDFAARDLAFAIEQEHDLGTVDGLVWKKDTTGKEQIVYNAPREQATGEMLDQLPFVTKVYKKHLVIEDYFYPSVLYPEVTLWTGRGCKFRCTFCKYPQTITGHDYRARSVKNVVDEFEWISKNLPQVKDIMVEDDTFTQDKERAIAICKEIIKRDLKVTWTVNARADVPLEVMEWMKKAGCRLMCVGFESATQEILNNIKKGTTVQKIRQFMKDTKQAKMLVHGCFMLGNRGETKATIQKTVAFAKELEPDTAQFFPLMVYPGTEAYEWAKKEGYLTTQKWNEWLLPDGSHNTLVSRPGLSGKELVEACDNARLEFYLRPSYIGKKVIQGLTTPSEFPRLMKSSYTFYKFLWKHLKYSVGVREDVPGTPAH
jgi:anaerobic magnesium-protoporphyrin IX monomethyl ester cyclase